MGSSSRPNKYRDGWRIKWTNEKGKRCSASYINYAEAESVLLQKKAEVDQIKKGLQVRFDEDKSFCDLATFWIEKVTPLKRSGKDIESIIQTHLRPSFGSLKLHEITQEHAQDYCCVKEQKGLSKKTVANHLVVFISMLNYAREMKWLREVPRIRKPKISRRAHVFSYLKDNEEVKRFLLAAKAEGACYYSFYATAILSGLRAGELAGLKWDDVNLSQRILRVQRSYNSPTKSGNIRHVPILDPLVPILTEWSRNRVSEYVFTSNTGSMIGESSRIFQEIFRRVLHRAGFDDVERGGKARGYIRFHDLRHTFASHWMMKNGDIYRLQQIMGHQSVEMTQRYSHLSPNIFKEDYSRFDCHRLTVGK